jgi:hypothetical protein
VAFTKENDMSINLDGLAEKDFEAVAAKLAAAKVMLRALRALLASSTGLSNAKHASNTYSVASAAISEAEEAGITS